MMGRHYLFFIYIFFDVGGIALIDEGQTRAGIHSDPDQRQRTPGIHWERHCSECWQHLWGRHWIHPRWSIASSQYYRCKLIDLPF